MAEASRTKLRMLFDGNQLLILQIQLPQTHPGKRNQQQSSHRRLEASHTNEQKLI
jgi:hypothetical protein